MNWTIHKTENQPFIKVVAEGDFDLTEHQKMLQEIVSSDFWKTGTGILIDYRNLEFGLTDISTAKDAALNYQKFEDQLRDCKIAKIMKSLADYGRGRQLELLAKGQSSMKPRTFLDEKEALDWLIS